MRWLDLRRDGLVADGVLALVVGVGSLAGHYLATGTDVVAQRFDGLGFVLLAVGAAALAARRRTPLTVLVVTGLGVVVSFALDLDHDGPFVILPLLVALYTVTESGRRAQAVVAAGVVLAAVGASVLTIGPLPASDDTQGLLWATGWLAASIVAGEVVKSRRDYLGEVEARAVEAERTREEEGRRRAGEERLRIARELHDVLGHSLSLINVQAGMAAHVIDRQPDQASAALQTIKEASKQALDELRGTLGALQQSDETAPRMPPPTVARLDDLVRPVAAAGVEVEVAVTGEPRPLPAAIDQAAYRIVQESLTNVIRHADTATAMVRIGYGEHDLAVEVGDAGRRVADPAQLEAGSGIAGMRERAVAMGGELQIASGAEGGVRVRARLPLDGAS